MTTILAMPTICAIRLPISSASPGFFLVMLTKHRPVASTGVCRAVTFGMNRCTEAIAICSSGAVGKPRVMPVNWLTIQGLRRCVTVVTFIQKFSALRGPM